MKTKRNWKAEYNARLSEVTLTDDSTVFGSARPGPSQPIDISDYCLTNPHSWEGQMIRRYGMKVSEPSQVSSRRELYGQLPEGVFIYEMTLLLRDGYVALEDGHIGERGDPANMQHGSQLAESGRR